MPLKKQCQGEKRGVEGRGLVCWERIQKLTRNEIFSPPTWATQQLAVPFIESLFALLRIKQST